MSDYDIRDVSDSLSTTTRAERKGLLVASTTLVLLSWGGLAPTKVAAFGLEIGAVKTVLLVAVAWAVTAYFLMAFVFYHRADRFAAEDQLTRLQAEAADSYFARLKEEMGDDVLKKGGKTHETVTRAFHNSFTRHIRLRYEFDYWSALTIGGGSLLAGAIWFLAIARDWV